MKRVLHEKELEEGDFLLFLYDRKALLNRSVYNRGGLTFDYGLVTEASFGEVLVKWFFDPCEDADNIPEVIDNVGAFKGKFYLIKKDVPIHF
jgi:hypothetical protein